jgi:hypothetical protein
VRSAGSDENQPYPMLSARSEGLMMSARSDGWDGSLLDNYGKF